MHSRRKAASAYSMSRLGATFEQLFNPTCVNFRLPDPLQIAQKTPPSFRKVITDKLGPAGEAFSHIRNRIVPMHDGGFFSIFNTFMTHLVWDVREPRCQRVLPDWDVGRLLARMGNINPTSFCYGLPEDGNIWCKLFEPLFGLTPEQMDDAKFIYRHATLPDQQFNELREPNLTYIHAYKLYHTTDFRFWRQQYHRLLQQHVKPLPHLQRTIDEFVAKHFRRPFMIAAHVRHPSHTVEQPDKKIAFTEDYINEIYTLIARHNIDRTSDHWGIFLATDQQHVVRAFEVEFGSRVCYYPDVVRTTDQDDRVYNSLSEADKNKDGHQLQHLLAARRNWSTKYAEEIIIDAYTMACCNALLHVVSNVSTAVSYINPNIEMVFCAPKTQANAMAA